MTSVEVVLSFVDPCREGVPESDTDSSVVFVCKDDNRYVYIFDSLPVSQLSMSGRCSMSSNMQIFVGLALVCK